MGGTGGAGGAKGLSWEPCALVTGASDMKAECATMTAPARYDVEGGTTIPLFVKRIPAKETSRGQIWLLSGGPGQPGASLESFAKTLAAKDPSLDVYLPDHRGTGSSARLSCATAEADDSDGGIAITDAEIPGCIDALKATWGDDLAGFNTTNAAKDLAGLVGATRAAGDEVHLFGISYGTSWALRYLSLFPDQATSATLDSLVTPDVYFSDLDNADEAVAKLYFEACAADALCASKLGPDPWKALDDTFAALDAGACPAVAALGIDRPTLRWTFGALLRTWAPRVIIPAVVYRLSRCDAADVAALQHLMGVLFPADPPAPTPAERLASALLGPHIGLSEIWEEPPPPLDGFATFVAGAHAVEGSSLMLAGLFDAWPRYARDAHASEWPATSVPLLMLQTTLDPATPYATVAPGVAAHLHGPNQTFVTFPGGTHLALNSPAATGAGCLPMIVSFTKNPTSPVDTSCIADLAPVTFEGSASLAALAFGAADIWENAAPAAPLAAPSSEASEAFALSIRQSGLGRSAVRPSR